MVTHMGSGLLNCIFEPAADIKIEAPGLLNGALPMLNVEKEFNNPSPPGRYLGTDRHAGSQRDITLVHPELGGIELDPRVENKPALLVGYRVVRDEADSARQRPVACKGE